MYYISALPQTFPQMPNLASSPRRVSAATTLASKQRSSSTDRMRRLRAQRTEEEKERERASDRARKKKRSEMAQAELAKLRASDGSRKKKRSEMSQLELAKLRASNRESQRRSREASATRPRNPIDNTHVEFYSVGSMDVECSHCGALHFAEEKVKGRTTFNDCCRHGTIPAGFPSWPDYPDELKHWFVGDYNADDKWDFLENIRGFNNAFAMASFCCQRYRFRSPWPPCERIYGQTFHFFNQQLMPESESQGRITILTVCEA
jgi:hypothetical protein